MVKHAIATRYGIDKVKYQEKDSQIIFPVNSVLEHFGSKMADMRGYSGEKFYADSKCFLCYACINYCPVHSIQIKSSRLLKIYTYKNGRYFHPEATVNDIYGQK